MAPARAESTGTLATQPSGKLALSGAISLNLQDRLPF